LNGLHTVKPFHHQSETKHLGCPSTQPTQNLLALLLSEKTTKAPRTENFGTCIIIGDPGLFKTGTPLSFSWFELTSGSPAIDHALSLAEIKEDFLKNSRGIFQDLGALEYFPNR
jgi:hypothetical protein